MYGDGCVTNEDCAPDYRCDYPSGACQPPQFVELPPGPDRCNKTSDCADGKICDRYLRCVTPGGESGTGGAGGEAGAPSSGAGG